MRTLAVTFAVLVLAPQAQAQSEEDLARARERFSECVASMDAERNADAVDCFREVMAIRATPQVKYNLALALERMGHLAEASALLDEALGDGSLDRRSRRGARRLLRTIEPRLGYVTIRVDGDDGASVLLDGDDIGLDRLGTPIAVDPGTHQVRLRGASAGEQVRVAAGETSEVTLTREASTDLPRPTLPEGYGLPEEHGPATTSANVTEQWWFWTAIGTIGVAVIAIVAAVAASQ